MSKEFERLNTFPSPAIGSLRSIEARRPSGLPDGGVWLVGIGSSAFNLLSFGGSMRATAYLIFEPNETPVEKGHAIEQAAKTIRLMTWAFVAKIGFEKRSTYRRAPADHSTL
jgi:hypothetical protein